MLGKTKKTLCNLLLLGVFSFPINGKAQEHQIDEISTATITLNRFLTERDPESGFVRGQQACPKDTDAFLEYGTSFEVKPIDKTSSIVTIYAMSCPVGNGVDEYIVYIKNGKGRVVANDLVGAMKMQGDVWVDGDNLYIKGNKWLEQDAHCCPSLSGTLKYNLKTGYSNFQNDKKRRSR